MDEHEEFKTESEAEWQLAQAIKKIDKLEDDVRFYKEAYTRLTQERLNEQF